MNDKKLNTNGEQKKHSRNGHRVLSYHLEKQETRMKINEMEEWTYMEVVGRTTMRRKK